MLEFKTYRMFTRSTCCHWGINVEEEATNYLQTLPKKKCYSHQDVLRAVKRDCSNMEAVGDNQNDGW